MWSPTDTRLNTASALSRHRLAGSGRAPTVDFEMRADVVRGQQVGRTGVRLGEHVGDGNRA